MANSFFPSVQSYYEGTRWDYRWVWGVRNTYALHFGYYDEQATHHRAAVANMNKVMADLVAIQPGEKVLDAGCGVGGSSIWLAQNRNCTAVGITPVESQVKDAVRNARALFLPLVQRAEILQFEKLQVAHDRGERRT
jgi:cyclopropane fatty-acyl-phospholipid synthase-like methyltransferase